VPSRRLAWRPSAPRSRWLSLWSRRSAAATCRRWSDCWPSIHGWLPRGSATTIPAGCRGRCCTSRPTGPVTSPTVRRPSRCWSRRAPTSTPASLDRTKRHRCTGRPAATTSRCWTRSSTPAPTSRQPAASSVAAPRSRTPERSGSGRQRIGWCSVEHGPPSTMPRRSGWWTASSATSRAPSRRRRRRSTAPSGGACHGGQQQCAAHLLDRGADLNWIPEWERLTPLDAARRSDAVELVGWLRGRGAKAATELDAP
jgi:hypothetical protein